MSKSKKNVVDPQKIVETFGADTCRLFMLSDSPPDRDLEWTDAGIEGAWRYVNRLFRLIAGEEAGVLAAKGTPQPTELSEAAANCLRLTHKIIDAVTADLDRLHFNKAVARVRELSNALAALEGDGADVAWVRRFTAETIIRLIGPMMPHLAEELWAELGHDADGLLLDQPWPIADAAWLVEDKVTVAVQVNGKMRATIDLPRDAAEDVARETALAHENVQRVLEGKAPRKVIVVPNRIVNVVA